MDKTDRLRDYGLAFLLYKQGLSVCGYELIRELFIFIKLILNSYLQQKVLGPVGEIKHAKMAVRILTRIAHFKPYPTEIQNNPFTENHPKTKCKTLPSFC